MRISCDVKIASRVGASLNLRGNSKSSRATLIVGKNVGNDPQSSNIFILVCTLTNKFGTKYKIKDNIQQVFSKFVSLGKATVQFLEPPHDLLINKADPLQLKTFLQAVNLGLQDQSSHSSIFSHITPSTSFKVCKPVKKLRINCPKDLPITGIFPRSLEFLHIQHCSLERIDSRILKLKHLRTLDLSYNFIKVFPEIQGSTFPLAELILHSNELKVFPAFLSSHLQHTLKKLDLSRNLLTKLPETIGNFLQLITLKVENNEIDHLPESIGNLSQLRFLSAFENKISLLPASFMKLNLDEVSVWGNPFVTVVHPEQTFLELPMPSLQELAAVIIKKQRFKFRDSDIPFHLRMYLRNSHQCLCGAPCFESSIKHIVMINLHTLSDSVHVTRPRADYVPVQIFICSLKCYNLYSK